MEKNKEILPQDAELDLGAQELIESEAPKKRSRGGALTVMALTMLSRVFGFVRVKVTAMYFGATIEADILNYVFGIPNNLRKIFAEGSLTTAFMPEFIAQIKDGKERNKKIRSIFGKEKMVTSANQLLVSFLSFQGLIIGALIFLCLLFSYPIMQMMSGFRGGDLVLASQLFSWLIVYILFVSISAIFSGVLNAHREFTIPAFSPLLFSIGSIASIMIWQGSLGIFSVVVGIWLGGLLQMLVHFPSLYRLGYRGIFTSWRIARDPALTRIIRRWLPILGVSLLTAITQQIQFSLATLMREGDVSVLTSAIVFFQLPFGILYTSIAVVFFPKLSSAHLDDKKDKFQGMAGEGMNLLILLLAPASVWLFIWAEPILTLFLQGGMYGREATLRTVWVLQIFSTHLLIMGLFSFLLRIFYALGKTHIPFYLALFASIGEVVFAFLFMDTLGVSSIPWGTTAIYGVALVAGLVALTASGYRLGIFGWLKTLAQVLIALIPTFILYGLSLHFWQWGDSFNLVDFVVLGILGILSVASCFYLYYAWKIPSFLGLFNKKTK